MKFKLILKGFAVIVGLILLSWTVFAVENSEFPYDVPGEEAPRVKEPPKSEPPIFLFILCLVILAFLILFLSKFKDKAIWAGLGLGIISSLYFIYKAVGRFYFKEEPILYTFTSHPFAIVLAIIPSMIFWIFLAYLTKETIEAKSIIKWGAFLGGTITFAYTVLFVELDPAGGLIQLSFITLFGLIGGIIIAYLVKIVKKLIMARKKK